MQATAKSWQARMTRSLLWVAVLAWGVLVGGKLFDNVVLVGAWSAAPPESLSLLPYGPRYPVDTGDFFFPSSVALLVCSVGLVISGWRTPLSYRVWLLVPAAMLLATLVFTIAWFWPANRALWRVAQGAPTAMQDPAEITRLVRAWVAYDWIRIGAGLLGFISCVRALSIPFPSEEDRHPAKSPN